MFLGNIEKSSGNLDNTQSNSSQNESICSGVRRKAIPSSQTSEIEPRNGTKKKIRPNCCYMKSPVQEYQLWDLRNQPEVSRAEGSDLTAFVNYHRPLERSFPPTTPSKLLKSKHTIEEFSFDIVDTDEQQFLGSDNLVNGIDFIELCEFDSHRKKEKRPHIFEDLNIPPLAVFDSETDGSLSENTPSKFLLKKQGISSKDGSIAGTPNSNQKRPLYYF